jgi:uncharacterized membrane protein
MLRDNRDAGGISRLDSNETGMGKSRLEGFSDGLIAIIITVMVLELKVPEGDARCPWACAQA